MHQLWRDSHAPPAIAKTCCVAYGRPLIERPSNTLGGHGGLVPAQGGRSGQGYGDYLEMKRVAATIATGPSPKTTASTLKSRSSGMTRHSAVRLKYKSGLCRDDGPRLRERIGVDDEKRLWVLAGDRLKDRERFPGPHLACSCWCWSLKQPPLVDAVKHCVRLEIHYPTLFRA